MTRSLLGLALVWTGCVATPLPTPPTVEPTQMSIVEGAQPGEVDLRGEPGAIRGDLLMLRVSSEGVAREVSVAGDGSFTASALPVVIPPVLYLEALTADDDVFLIALTRGPGAAAVTTDAGPDRDMDGSPDAIDCAPDDSTLVGQRCRLFDDDGDGFSPPEDCDDMNANAFPGATEICNGDDDNCDGTIDEMCAPCASDSDCSRGRRCVMGRCAP